MKLLSVMAACRLDDDVDTIESTLSLALMDPKSTNQGTSVDPLASSSWAEVIILIAAFDSLKLVKLYLSFST